MRPWSMLEGATPNYSAWGITGAGSSVGVLLKCPTPGPRGPASPSHDFPPLYLIRAREIFVGPIVTNFGGDQFWGGFHRTFGSHQRRTLLAVGVAVDRDLRIVHHAPPDFMPDLCAAADLLFYPPLPKRRIHG